MDNYSYPAGADNSSAPWNQGQNEIGFEVEVSERLVKIVTLHTDDYYTETDEDGDSHTVRAYHDWKNDYEQECFTLLDMLDEFKKMIENELQTATGQRATRLHKMLNDCQGWTQDEFYAEES